MTDPTYEAVGTDSGEFLILDRSERAVVTLPIVTVHDGAVVCEFRRDADQVSLDRAIALIQHELLEVFLGGSYAAPVFELVDLDASRWARVPMSSSPPDTWTSVEDAWPPGIARRTTALEGAPHDLELAVLRSVPFRFRLQAMTVSAAGEVVVARGKKGVVQRVDWDAAKAPTIARLDRGIGRLHAAAGGLLAWSKGIVRWRDGAWHDPGLAGTASALSPDGTRLAVGDASGEVRVVATDDFRELTRFSLRSGASPQARWSREGQLDRLWSLAFTGDGARLVAGHTWPVVGVYDAVTGVQQARHEGTQHFQASVVASGTRLLAGLRMNATDVLDAEGNRVVSLPNSSNHGLKSGGFGRRGRVAVTECNEGVARVWRVADGIMLGQFAAAKGEPLVVLDDRVVARDPVEKALVEVALPEV